MQNVKGLEPVCGETRVKLCEIAAQEYSWINVSDWESNHSGKINYFKKNYKLIVQKI